MTSATLCQLCQSISLQSLPPFPDDSYRRTVSGRPNLQKLVHREENDPIPTPFGFPHHLSLEALRAASAASCELCRQIETGADGLLADLTSEKEWRAKYPEVPAERGDPSFELWITKRGEGGDGFWVSTKCASEPENTLFIVATFGLCIDDDDNPLAVVFPGRPINGPPDENALDRSVAWVRACDTHENCTGHGSSLPTRLIDLGGPGPETTVRLVEPGAGTSGTYTALSYCWGDSNAYTTTRSLLSARKEGMSLSDLPPTFQDAIAMTRRLEVRYIWIDSLCICQDDLRDWERESAGMAAVYQNAYLTIAATGKPDTSGGLFFERPGKPYLRTTLTTTRTSHGNIDTDPSVSGNVLIFPLNDAKEVIRSRRLSMTDEPLATRGWAFQERLLARRVLHFASDQIFFECLEGTILEDGLRIPYRHLSAYPDKEPISKGESGKREDTARTPRAEGQDKAIHHWHSLVKEYNRLKLTFPSDVFPALSGVAKVYQSLLDDEYVAGIWRKTMIEELCWQSLSCTAVSEYRAPSWSWASVYGSTPAGFNGTHRDVGTILDHHVEIDGDNPFGRVKDAWIKVEAPLVPLSLSEKTGPTGHMCGSTGSGNGEDAYLGFDTIDRNYSVSAEMVRKMKLFVLVLAVIVNDEGDMRPDSGLGENEPLCYMCILVTPGREEEAVEVGPAMRRVGFTIQLPETFGPGLLDSCRAIVTLV
ncbi:uncharacterized protein DNG_02295 [Cephalotrichum gorgonifer]|uniref:Heterokaryon incompatibility domain-containing protein n=1 Tax=Cephalotrichum gorgonifer TaxID=2041049 RepID=A0AAE8ST47_9PEZI|nr:uncharacterized protein DNG_02295 [Cephalotrichum gorgonifer]